MALRFRTRLTLTVSALTIFITSVMTLAAAILFAEALNRQMWEQGRFLTAVANQNIQYGLSLSSKVEQRIKEQMQVTALLSAELADRATRQESITAEELAGVYEKVLAKARTSEGLPVIGSIKIDGPHGTVVLGDRPASPSGVSVTGTAGDYRVEVGTSESLELAIREDFRLQGFIERFMFENNFRRIAVLAPDGTVVAAVDSEGRTGPEVIDDGLREISVNYLRELSITESMDEEELSKITLIGGDVGVFTPLESLEDGQTYSLFIQHNAGQGLRFISNRVMALVSLGVIMFLIGIVVTVLLSRSLSQPIVYLTSQVREFGKGNLNHRLTWKRKDEFRDLAETFNIMAISLQEYMHELERETSQRERLESELRIASQMQTALLPEAPPIVPGLKLTGMSQPSRDVGGDFFDFLELSPTKIGVLVGDATGKGLSAALLITQCASVLRTLSNDISDPGELLRRTNLEFFTRIGSTHRFVTLFLMVIDTEKGVAWHASAGHPPPMMINRRKNRYEWLSGTSNYPLGIMRDTQYEVAEIQLEAGDTFVLFSDGVTEAQNARRELYGEERVKAFLTEAATDDPEALLTGLRDSAIAYMGDREASDDMTIVVARFDGLGQTPHDEGRPAASAPHPA